jgi:hypothetical protein
MMATVNTKNILLPMPNSAAILFIIDGKRKMTGTNIQKSSQKMKALKEILSFFSKNPNTMIMEKAKKRIKIAIGFISFYSWIH